jgi:hypothetical protein
MKKKQIGLEIDYIGGQGPLTEAEEKALGEFFRQRKADSKRPPVKQHLKK